MNTILSLIFLMIVFGIYFLPAIVAKDKKDRKAIMVLNFFLGWTLIGWVAALIWAVKEE